MTRQTTFCHKITNNKQDCNLNSALCCIELMQNGCQMREGKNIFKNFHKYFLALRFTRK